MIDLVNAHYRRTRRGLVLWIVPTTQIYRQTLKALKDRDHPYRQQLDLASGQRTRILEKTTAFGPSEVAENLCVLLLMLPSANRKTKDALRMFRDSGGFDRFFPPDDDPAAHAALLEEHPNLDTFEQTAGYWGRYIKTSLGNTIRLLQPLIILDEGHKAYSPNAKATLEGFNPCMIVELSATPAKGANVLVEILGRELEAEEMIKLDLHILNKQSGDWRDTLLAAVEHRATIEESALVHEAESGTYIRPICVIQVERTGKEQRRPGYVHTDDVREYLLQHPGIAPEQIAVKTSSKDELKEVDDIGGLMSRDCPAAGESDRGCRSGGRREGAGRGGSRWPGVEFGDRLRLAPYRVAAAAPVGRGAGVATAPAGHVDWRGSGASVGLGWPRRGPLASFERHASEEVK